MSFESYDKVRIVGRGAYGVCWLCKEKMGNRQKVIIKTIPMTSDEQQKIMSEVKLLQKMKHPLIIGYHNYFMLQAENQLAIVMQFAEGGTLEKHIHDQQGSHFTSQIYLNYFTQICIALHYMHNKQIVHRDLKTQNILLNRKKTIVKLSDFGISKELNTKSVAHTLIGTPNYLSPEICEGRAYNQKCDIWSLGCILFELVELKKAFDGENIPAIVMKISRGDCPKVGTHAPIPVTKLVESLLSKNEHKRPALKEILTCPLLLPHALSIHVDVGRLSIPQKDKRKISVLPSSRLGTQPIPTTRTMRTNTKLSGIQQIM